jgi:hypothetical protein
VSEAGCIMCFLHSLFNPHHDAMGKLSLMKHSLHPWASFMKDESPVKVKNKGGSEAQR